MKKVLLLFTLCFICSVGKGEESVKVEDKIFNFGMKVGLNSTMPIVNSISINDVSAQNISYQHKVGFLGAAFCRINIDHFFLQPSLSWTKTSGDIYFQIQNDPAPESGTSALYDCLLKYNIKSIEMPVLVGYKIIKDDIYGLSLMAGPSFKYSYKIRYSANFPDAFRKYESDSTPWGIGIVCGVGVTINRLFFDVTYEFGLNRVDSDFTDITSTEVNESNISINRHTNMLGISLGFLF